MPGPVVRYNFVAHEVVKLAEIYDMRTLSYDRWRIDDFKQDLLDVDAYEEDQFELTPFGQGFKDMSPAIDYFVDLALSGCIRHGGNPVLSACVANAITVQDPAGNLKVDKDKSNKRGICRIDGAITTIMALGTAKRFEDEPGDPLSPWDQDPEYRLEI